MPSVRPFHSLEHGQVLVQPFLVWGPTDVLREGVQAMGDPVSDQKPSEASPLGHEYVGLDYCIRVVPGLGRTRPCGATESAHLPPQEPKPAPPLCKRCGLTRGTLIHRPAEFADDEGAEECHPFEEPTQEPKPAPSAEEFYDKYPDGRSIALESCCAIFCAYCSGGSVALPYEKHGVLYWTHRTTGDEEISCLAAPIRLLWEARDAQIRSERDREFKELRDILAGYPAWHCYPDNSCYEECSDAWRDAAEHFKGVPPKHKCQRCGSNCTPFQLSRDLCRWCEHREVRAEAEAKRAEQLPDYARRAESDGYERGRREARAEIARKVCEWCATKEPDRIGPLEWRNGIGRHRHKLYSHTWYGCKAAELGVLESE